MSSAHAHAEADGGFARFGLDSTLARALVAAGFSEPRPIQAETGAARPSSGPWWAPWATTRRMRSQSHSCSRSLGVGASAGDPWQGGDASA